MIELSIYVILFFAYCFVGWVWECLYVSVRQKKWVNRGFCRGPFLPIYGSGAMIIIITTYNVRDSVPLTFVVSIFSCSLLEYFTGAAMEKLFNVRYWDYSDKPLNLNGHIYWASCLLWGFAGVGLMQFVYPPTYELISEIPHVWREGIALVLTIGFTADFTSSFKTALDFKALLLKLSENNSAVEGIRERAVKLSDGMTKSTAELKERTAQMMKELSEAKDKLYEARDKLEEKTREAIDNVPKTKQEYVDLLHDKYESFSLSAQEKLQAADNYIRGNRADEELTEEEKAEKERTLLEISYLKAAAKKLYSKLPSLPERQYRDTKSLLKRNPTAVSPKYQAAFEELKKTLSERKTR